MKNVLVLGGSGFVGRHVCEKLARQGWTVTVPTRKFLNAQSVVHVPRLTVLELDVHDEAALAQAVAGHDAVVNLVAILHGDQTAFEHAHVALPQKLAKACVAACVGQVVHVSALGADALQSSMAPSMYLRTKGEGEAVLVQAAMGAVASHGAAEKGFDLSILRPSVIFGAEDRFMNTFAGLQKIAPVVPLACADARFAPVWVEDVAQAVVRCLQGGLAQPSPRTYELAGPEVYTLRQLVNMAGRLSGIAGGCGRTILSLPDWAGRLQARLLSWLPGPPLLSQDNLDSMQVPNVASGKWPGLAALGITASPLAPLAAEFLRANTVDAEMNRLRATVR